MIKDIVLQTRSYRKFDSSYIIERNVLESLVDISRNCASGANKQPLKYYLSVDKDTNNTIFSHLKWAAMLSDWDGPTETERPTSYIVVLQDDSIWNAAISANDAGIASQTILLAATEQGISGCMFTSFAADSLKTSLSLPENLVPKIVIALGKATETVVLEDVANDKTAYYRDEENVHHVPKRTLKEVLVN